ncbi:hypothetical protein WDW86_01430 [Bdellovibrionota bacterium FG-2]
MCAKLRRKTIFQQKIVSLLNKSSVIETDSLREYFSGRSRRSVFRDLAGIEHLSSMTHAGRYITLPHVPQFDANGLWFFRDIGFSINGSIKKAIQRVVSESDAGFTHKELKRVFHVRLHNSLVELVRTKKLTRQLISDNGLNLYLSGDPLSSRKQLENRNAFANDTAVQQNLPPLVVIQVLVEIIRGGEVHINDSDVFSRLCRAGAELTSEQVHAVFVRYGIGVKKLRVLDSGTVMP